MTTIKKAKLTPVTTEVIDAPKPRKRTPKPKAAPIAVGTANSTRSTFTLADAHASMTEATKAMYPEATQHILTAIEFERQRLAAEAVKVVATEKAIAKARALELALTTQKPKHLRQAVKVAARKRSKLSRQKNRR